MVNYNQAYLESLVKPGSTRLSILVDNCQKPGKSGSTRVYQAHQAFNPTFGARDITKRRIFQLILSFFDYKQTLYRDSTNRVLFLFYFYYFFLSNHD